MKILWFSLFRMTFTTSARKFNNYIFLMHEIYLKLETWLLMQNNSATIMFAVSFIQFPIAHVGNSSTELVLTAELMF